MELDGREVAGSSVEPEQGANADIAAEKSPSSVEMVNAKLIRVLAQMPAQIPVMNRKAAVRQRYPGMTNGMIRFWMALTASLRNSVT